jgi:hypothetical protein
MARGMVLLYRGAQSAGSSIDSGILATQKYDQVLITLVGATATSGICAVYTVDSLGAKAPAAAASVASVAASAISNALSTGPGLPCNIPVPAAIQVTCAGATTSALICEVWGVQANGNG